VVGVLHELVTALNRVADLGKLDDPASVEKTARADFLDGAEVVKGIADVLGLTFAAEEKISAAATPRDRPHATAHRPANTLRATAKGIADKADPIKKSCSTRLT